MKITSAVSAFFWFVAGSVFGEYIEIGVGNFNSWFWAETGSAPVMKIDLQTKIGCPGGNLADLRKKFTESNLWLERGADSLFICSDNAISTTVDDAPRVLAREFPGCLNYITGSLRMLRASEAICGLPDNRGYICDGVKGTEGQGTEALGSESSVVKPCAPEILTKFGFPPGS